MSLWDILRGKKRPLEVQPSLEGFPPVHIPPSLARD